MMSLSSRTFWWRYPQDNPASDKNGNKEWIIIDHQRSVWSSNIDWSHCRGATTPTATFSGSKGKDGLISWWLNGNSRKCHVQVPHFSMEKKSDCIGLPLGSKFHKIQVQKVASEMWHLDLKAKVTKEVGKFSISGWSSSYLCVPQQLSLSQLFPCTLQLQEGAHPPHHHHRRHQHWDDK